MNLLIDMGNTRLKWAISDNFDIVPGTPIANANIDRARLMQLWQTIAPPKQLAIACVSASQLCDLVIAVVLELWPGITIVQVKSEAQAFGIFNAYQEPEKLGVDRWLGMVSGYNKYRKALCVVSCGTAITLDIVDDSGTHLGGLISPGLRLMKQALSNNAENLDLNETAYPLGLATFTDAAIYNGALSAACGFIEFALANQPEDLPLLITGGDAEAIAAHLTRSVIIHADLVLHGLALMLNKQS
jgi:type III pantothenate kinase